MLKNHPKFKLIDIASSTKDEAKYGIDFAERDNKDKSDSESSMSDPDEILKVLANAEDSNESDNKYLKRILRKEFNIKHFETEDSIEMFRHSY